MVRTIVDENGKPRRRLSDAGKRYKQIRVHFSTLPHCKAAFVASRLGDALWLMGEKRLQGAVSRALAHWDGATKQEKEAANRRAAEWESNPEFQGTMAIYEERALTKAEVGLERVVTELARLAFSDARQVMSWGSDGVTLKESSTLTDEEASSVSEVSEVMGKEGVRGVRVKMHSKPEALSALLKYFAPEKAATASAGGDTYNTLVVGDLKQRFTIEELRGMVAQLKGGA